jgi:hypothetical protein
MAAQWIRWVVRIAIVVAVVALLAVPWAFSFPWVRSLLRPQWDTWTIAAVAVDAALLLVVAIWWLWWRLPKRQVTQLSLKIRDPKARADTEDNFRKTVGQALGGAAVLIGAAAAYLQFTQQQQASRDQLQATHDLLISNQVSKGFEQLAGKETAMRLGGIYALEGVMNASPEYHQPVLEALCAFVRDSTIGMIVDKDHPATDIQAALTVIGRRVDGTGVVNLSEANIPRAVLSSTRMSNAYLIKADLSGANLSDADLSGANLSGAKLREADLSRANLMGAYLYDANLNGAPLFDANLRGADLREAHLIDAILMGAHLNGANLSGADLRITALDGQEQLDEACGDAKLPPGLTLKPCPDDWERRPPLR